MGVKSAPCLKSTRRYGLGPGTALRGRGSELENGAAAAAAGEEPDEVEGAVESGARVCGDEAEVRICEAALPRTEEECQPVVCGVRAGEPVSVAEEAASGTSTARQRRLLITGRHRSRRKSGKNRIQTLARVWLNTASLKTLAYSEFP
jgi:hypothetical protein